MICRRSTKRRTEARNWTLIHVGTLLIALLLGWSAPGAASADTGVDSWPSFRGNARQTGVAAMPLARELELQWAFRMAPGEAPAANVDVGIESTAAIADGSAYVGGLDSQLYAIALGDGKLKWKYATAAPVTASPAVSGGAVFFGDESGLFHAVDAATGKGRWTFATDGKITASANAVEGKVIFGSYDTNLYCLAADTGAQIWRAETEDYVHGSPAVADSVALTAGCDGYLRLIGMESGHEVARMELGTYVGASLAVGGGSAYVGTFGNQVLGIDLTARRISWRYEPADRQSPFYASAAVTAEAIVIGGRDRSVHALDPDSGELLWSFDAAGKIDSSPVVAGDRVYFGSNDGAVYGVNLKSGDAEWQFDTGSPITASPAVAAGRLVIGTVDGTLFCFSGRN